MPPFATSIPDDPSGEPTSLQSAIQSGLRAAQHHAKQMQRVKQLEAKSQADREIEKETGKALFNVRSPFSPELLKERSPRGDYLRAIFHLLFMPIVTPHACRARLFLQGVARRAIITGRGSRLSAGLGPHFPNEPLI